MRKIFILIMVTVFAGIWQKADVQDVTVKTNGLYWLATTLNIRVEFATGNKWALELASAYNPWMFKNDKKMRLWLVQPEMKYCFAKKIEGHFGGMHLHGALFFGGFNKERYDGYLAGFGFNYGYDWILSPNWNIKVEIGLEYAHLWHDESGSP